MALARNSNTSSLLWLLGGAAVLYALVKSSEGRAVASPTSTTEYYTDQKGRVWTILWSEMKIIPPAGYTYNGQTIQFISIPSGTTPETVRKIIEARS